MTFSLTDDGQEGHCYKVVLTKLSAGDNLYMCVQTCFWISLDLCFKKLSKSVFL